MFCKIVFHGVLRNISNELCVYGGKVMISIAVVDDEKQILEEAKKILWDISDGYEDVRTDTFEKAEDFLNALSAYKYQILISDIDMPEVNGIELCEKTREVCPGIYVVFLTAYVEYAIDSYRMDAYQYILKTEMYSRFPEVLGKLLALVSKSQKNYCYVGTDNQKQRVLYCDIICITKGKRSKYVVYVMTNGELSERNSMEKILKKLDHNEFLMVERGCIVNLRHVVNIQENTLILSNKQTVDVSSRRVKHVKEGMSRYWRDE